MDIIYGLANRCFSYGIKDSSSFDSVESLDELVSIGIHRFDGAESYGWLLNDLLFFSHDDSIKVSTKIMLEHLKNYVHNHDYPVSLFSVPKNNIDIIYLHDRVTGDLLTEFNHLLKSHKSLSDYKWGLSIYTNLDIDLIEMYRPSCTYIQVPFNPLTRLDILRLIKMGYKVVIRSIFHQGVYFALNSLLITGFDEYRFLKHRSKLLKLSYELEISLGQLLFSYALINADLLGCSGVIVGSSSIRRLQSYILKHESTLNHLDISLIDDAWYSEKNIDPRNWNQ